MVKVFPEVHRSYLHPATLDDAKLHTSTDLPQGIIAKEHLDISVMDKDIQHRRFNFFHSDIVNL